MNLKKALYSVIGGNALAQVMTGLAGLVIINQLSPTDYAQFTLFQTLLLLVVGVVVNPLNRLVIIANEPLPLKSVFAFQSVLIIGFVSFSFSYFGQQLGLVLLFALGAGALVLFETVKSYAQRALDFAMYRRLVSWRALVFALPAICVAVLYQSVYLIASVMVLSWLAVAASFFRQVEMLDQSSAKPQSNLGPAVAIFAYFAFSSVLSQMDLFFLRYFSTEYELATYGASFQYYLFLILIMNSLKQVLLPMFSRGIESSLTSITKQLVPLYLLFTSGVAVLAVTSPIWTSMIEQEKYQTTDVVFVVLAFSSIFSLIFSPASELLQSRKQFKYMNSVLCVSVVVNFVLNYLLVDAYGARGVALSTLVTFAGLNIAFFVRGRTL